MNLQYLRMLLYQLGLVWPNGFREDFKDFYLYIPVIKTPNFGPILTLRIMIITNLNLYYLRMLHKSYSFCDRVVLEKILIDFLYVSLCNPLPLWPLPNPGDHDLNILHYLLLQKLQLFWKLLSKKSLNEFSLDIPI